MIKASCGDQTSYYPKIFSLNLLYFPIVILFCFYIYKHIQFKTITFKQKGKRVEPQVLKLIYGSTLKYLI